MSRPFHRFVIMLIVTALLTCWPNESSAQRRGGRLLKAIERATGANTQMRLGFEDLVEENTVPLDDESKKQLIDPLVAAINNRDDADKPFRIAVFPFGFEDRDPAKNGRISDGNVGQAIELQGTLISTIRADLGQRTPRSFLILDKFALEREFHRTHVDPTSISPDNPDLRNILDQLNVDAAVVGVNNWGKFKATVAFRKESNPTTKFVSNLGVHDIQAPYTSTESSRLGVSLYCRQGSRPDGEWIKVPIVTDKKNGVWGGDLYALVPEYCRRSEYKVVIANNGFQQRDIQSYLGSIANPNPNEELHRLYGVAVMVDGVNSFYEDVGLGPEQPGAVVVQPRDAKKWILGPRGYLIQAAQNGSPYLARTSGPDHSTLEVPGFQRNGETAEAFQFAGVGTGEGVVAEALGITENIGMISVFFFAEKLANDKHVVPQGVAATGGPEGTPQLGTAAGRQLARPTIGLNVEFHKRPVHQVHLLYRLAEDCPIPHADRVLVQ